MNNMLLPVNLFMATPLSLLHFYNCVHFGRIP
jgi:hypothetical protein